MREVGGQGDQMHAILQRCSHEKVVVVVGTIPRKIPEENESASGGGRERQDDPKTWQLLHLLDVDAKLQAMSAGEKE